MFDPYSIFKHNFSEYNRMESVIIFDTIYDLNEFLKYNPSGIEAFSFTPILQLIQTRRIFVPDQGNLENTTIQTFYNYMPAILEMSIKKDLSFTYNRFNA